MVRGPSNDWPPNYPRAAVPPSFHAVTPATVICRGNCLLEAPASRPQMSAKREKDSHSSSLGMENARACDAFAGETSPFLVNSQRSQCAAREFLLKPDVALFTGDEIAEHFFDPAMSFGKLNHSFREWRTPEISVEAPAHL